MSVQVKLWLLVGGVVAALILWSRTPFYGDSLFADDLWLAPGHSAAASATTTDYWKGRMLYTEKWEQPVRILITDKGVCRQGRALGWHAGNDLFVGPRRSRDSEHVSLFCGGRRGD